MPCRPSFARSEAQSQNPRPGCTLPGVDPATSRRMTGKGDGAERQRAGRRSARPPPGCRRARPAPRAVILRGAKRSRRTHVRDALCRGWILRLAQDDGQRGRCRSTASRASFCAPAPPAVVVRGPPQQLSFCAERSAVAEPTPGMHFAGGGSCDFAQDDGQRGRRRATASGRRSARSPQLSFPRAPTAVILRGAKRSRRIHPRRGVSRRVDPATARRTTCHIARHSARSKHRSECPGHRQGTAT